jgi:hypothetical protein
MKRILITASRDWTEVELMVEAIRSAGPGRVVHGAARGGDRLADSIAWRFMQTQPGLWDVEPHGADWDKYGNAAGVLRNQEMVDLGADICLAFPLEGSVGTFDCAARASLAGIHVRFTTDMDEAVVNAAMARAIQKVLRERSEQ